mgnify:CR=1 FL=1
MEATVTEKRSPLAPLYGLARWLRRDLRAGITVYLKGSRVNRLERVAGALSAAAAGAAAGGH